MEGHLLAPLLEDPAPAFPFVALLVSGGHTQLVGVEGVGRYRILGESLDDAAGEAFDKTAKTARPALPRRAGAGATGGAGRSGALPLPRPMTDRPGLDFSFSGLKTFALNTLRNSQRRTRPDPRRHRPRLRGGRGGHPGDQVPARARARPGLTRLILAGGVSANRRCVRAGPNAANRRAGLLPAPGIVHRQRGHDRLCRLPAVGGRAV